MSPSQIYGAACLKCHSQASLPLYLCIHTSKVSCGVNRMSLRRCSGLGASLSSACRLRCLRQWRLLLFSDTTRTSSAPVSAGVYQAPEQCYLERWPSVANSLESTVRMCSCIYIGIRECVSDCEFEQQRLMSQSLAEFSARACCHAALPFLL